MPKTKLNRFQKKALKGKEERVTGEEIWRLVELADSPDVEDRLEAAENLCPCHVRRRIDEVWEAIYRMLEDDDWRVRRAAFHTLFDGGSLDDPGLEPIFKRMVVNETYPKLKRAVEDQLAKRAGARDERESLRQKVTYATGNYPEDGRCDFCGEKAKVKRDYDTQIGDRAAMVCETCDG